MSEQSRTSIMAGLQALAVFAAASLLATSLAAAIDPLEFEDAQAERKYRTLIAEFRCPKCLNQNLAESDAPIAEDLRQAVFEQVQEGRSKDEIRRFMQERYGDFVLYNPPLRADTLLLWFGPVALALIGLAVAWRISRQRTTREAYAEAHPFDEAARARLRELLAEDDAGDDISDERDEDTR